MQPIMCDHVAEEEIVQDATIINYSTISMEYESTNESYESSLVESMSPDKENADEYMFHHRQ